MIELRDVSHAYDGKTVLQGVNLTLTERRIGVIGSNGSGKSTFVRLLNGLLLPSQGQVLVGSLNTREKAKEVRRRVGFVFQNPDNQIVFPVVEEDLAFGLKNLKLPPAEIESRITEVLARYDLQAFRQHSSHLLSGGQKQRLALAGAVIHSPELLFLDEPTSAVDPESRRDFWERLFELADAGTTLLVSTHYMDEAERCDALLLMRDGELLASDTPAGLLRRTGADDVEHAFLAQQMGVELVEGQDLFVKDDFVYMRTTRGPQRVDVIYRRIDDDYLDPMQFRPDSVLGVAGLVNAARAGNVVISSAVGNGVGDDKLVYTYVPTIIEYYLGEKPLLANVDTFRCWLDDECEEVLDRVDELVIKPVEGSGGYGIVFGPDASEKELATITKKIIADPRGWIAQPVMQLSTVPTHIDDKLAPRHVDLRPFAVNDGNDVWVLPGGLTRVALPEGQLVVNSSQGGGSKDTWVLGGRVPRRAPGRAAGDLAARRRPADPRRKRSDQGRHRHCRIFQGRSGHRACRRCRLAFDAALWPL